jgi:hypothetical protein
MDGRLIFLHHVGRLIASGRCLEGEHPARNGCAARPRTFTIPKSSEGQSRKAGAGRPTCPLNCKKLDSVVGKTSSKELRLGSSLRGVEERFWKGSPQTNILRQNLPSGLGTLRIYLQLFKSWQQEWTGWSRLGSSLLLRRFWYRQRIRPLKRIKNGN